MQVIANGKVVIEGTKQRNLYVLKGSTILAELNVTSTLEQNARLWHMRLGHMSVKG